MNKTMGRWKNYLMESQVHDIIIVIFGPTGCGKTTYKKYFESKGWRPVKSYTTRTPRPQEEGEYHFINEYEWGQMFNRGLLMNTNSYEGHYYGININDFVQTGKSVMVSDITSLNKLKRVAEQNNKELHFIYCAPDNVEELKRRHIERGTPERIAIMEQEIESEEFKKVLTLPNLRESLYIAYDLDDVREFEEQLKQ
ncbi:MAG: hypothetical protein CMI54_02595 [Parcubacteria group bacterium]|nr:hypothetical protein [Parcubacteria group bacterium]|tara:strand:+ start:1664 stop:2254 length:591 start_codon:yes stop_codon:yes gene_type:complete